MPTRLSRRPKLKKMSAARLAMRCRRIESVRKEVISTEKMQRTVRME
jgi:hypothetical protein